MEISIINHIDGEIVEFEIEKSSKSRFGKKIGSIKRVFVLWKTCCFVCVFACISRRLELRDNYGVLFFIRLSTLINRFSTIIMEVGYFRKIF
jgi:hypothetical protein